MTLPRSARASAVASSGLGLVALLGVAAIGIHCDTVPACTAPYCGECRTIAEGDVSVSGDLRVDGHLAAAYAVETAVIRRRAAFEADVLRLAAAHGLPAGQVTSTYVEDLLRVVAADVADHVANRADGGLRAVLRDSTCTASRAIAAETQVRCERAAGCSPGSASPVAASCDGRCLGVCDGECTGPLACGLVIPGSCEGSCEGSCALEPPGPCAGRCLGSCTGECSRIDPSGRCDGVCEGECEGACVPDEPGPCQGTCHGTCWVEPTSEACTGASECRGRCEGECEGECQGVIDPPGSSGCEATSACRAQASMQSLAAIDCSVPSVRLDYELVDGLDAGAVAGFVTRAELLAATGERALEGAAFFELLVAGGAEGVELVAPPPLDRLRDALGRALGRADEAGVELPLGRSDCIEPALERASDRMKGLPGSVADTRRAEDVLVAFLRELG